jgi:hypothetical protein
MKILKEMGMHIKMNRVVRKASEINATKMSEGIMPSKFTKAFSKGSFEFRGKGRRCRKDGTIINMGINSKEVSRVQEATLGIDIRGQTFTMITILLKNTTKVGTKNIITLFNTILTLNNSSELASFSTRDILGKVSKELVTISICRSEFTLEESSSDIKANEGKPWRATPDSSISNRGREEEEEEFS